VYWSEERSWFDGTVLEAMVSDTGALLHRILYDDAEDLWHDLSKEQFKLQTEEESVALREPPAAGRKRKHQLLPAQSDAG